MNRRFALFRKERWFPHRKSVLRGMIVFSLFASIIPIVAVGFGSYEFSSAAIRKEVNQANGRLLDNAASSVDTMMQRIENNVIQMLLGSFFGSNLQELKRSNYAGFYSSIYQNLSALQNSNKEIRDVTLYVPEDGYLISPSTGGRRLSDEATRSQLAEQMAAEQPVRWTYAPFPFLSENDPYGVTLVSKVPLYAKEPIGLLVLHLDSGLLQQMIARYTSYDGENMLILNADGHIVAYLGDAVASGGLYSSLKGASGPETRFTYTWNRTPYLATSVTSPYSGWIYADLIPVRALNAKSRGIALITAGMVAGFLLLGLCLALWGSRRAYRPIARLLAQVKGNDAISADLDEIGFVQMRWTELSETTSLLQNRLNEQLPFIIEMFALQLMQGHFAHYSDSQLRGVLEQSGIPSGREGAVFLLAYDRAEGGEGRFTANDQGLIVFTLKNIAQHMMEEYGMSGIAVHLLSEQAAVWIWDDAEPETDGGDWQARFKAFAEAVRKAAAGYLKLPVTAGLSDCGVPSELPKLYRQAAIAVRSRILYGSGVSIAYTGSLLEEADDYRYPIEIEARFDDALRLGDAEETDKVLQEFAAYMRKAGDKPELIRMSYCQLLTSALRTAYLIGARQAERLDEERTGLYADIGRYRTIADLDAFIRGKIVAPIVEFVQGKRNQENERLIGKVVQFIDTNYHLDLSLDQCAELCGLSPYYLSKLFKKMTGASFIEYLTACRVERAKALLRESELPVGGIAERVGYQPKNFIRVFKKVTGMTPGQFREWSGEAR
ncbi:AraC family transcriptional regulator [Gordoniibacillus kamchatkensis]|nr:AraC family transcriptional regulator [Paenibacillus sp. VKM B-2647]